MARSKKPVDPRWAPVPDTVLDHFAPPGILEAADVRDDQIEPLAEALRDVREAGGAHLLQGGAVTVCAVPLHIDNQQRSCARLNLRFRKRRPPGDVRVMFALRDHRESSMMTDGI